jgi:signal peptidase II
MNRLGRFALITVLLLACVGCDQATKNLVREHIALGDSQSYLADTFRLTHAENPGAFLSLGASLPEAARVAVFRVGVSLIVIGLLGFAMFAALDTWAVAGFALLAASGIGNLIDRWTHDGVVTDFLNLGVGSIRTGIFNVADMVGVAGMLVLLWTQFGSAQANRMRRG